MRGTLRKKRIARGTKDSLYIDYFPPVWNPIKKIYTRREWLKLHIFVVPMSSVEVQLNKLHQDIAEKIYIKRMEALMLEAHGIFNKDALNADFYQFAKNFIRAKQKEKIDTSHYETAIKYLEKFNGPHLKFKHIDEIFIERFKEFLKTTFQFKQETEKLGQNSQASYFDKFLGLVEAGFLQRYLPENYGLRVKRISNTKYKADLLDDAELKLLIDNPCENSLIYRSSLFALLTGFRFSAVEILKWTHLHWSEELEAWYFEIVDPKPKKSFKHYVSQEAIDFLGLTPTGNKDVLIFPGLNYSTMRSHLQQWFANLGLLKKAKFHNWRRMYATKLVEGGEDIYVVSKMLNHEHVSTTQIYAQVPATTRVKASKRFTLKKRENQIPKRTNTNRKSLKNKKD